MLARVIGEDTKIQAIRDQVARLVSAQRLPTVLILGETGTGKTLLARELHAASPRAAAPFVSVNCAAIPDSLLESELFGVERGAFTDAREPRPGLLQAAHRGVLFLDEIGCLPLRLQPKLLTVLEEWKVRRLGATRAETVDVWLIAATSDDLERAIAEQRFLRALYHRLAVMSLRVPPLRERPGDVARIAEDLLANVCRSYGLPPKRLGAGALGELRRHSWPGNVRELGNVIERAALLSSGAEIASVELAVEPAPAPAGEEGHPGVGRYERRTEEERGRLERALVEAHGNVSEAARLLGLPRNTVRYRLKRHGLAPESFAEPAAAAAVAPAPAPAPATPPRPRVAALRWEKQQVAFLTATAARADAGLDTLDDKIELFGGRLLERDEHRTLAIFGLGAVEDGARRAVLAALTSLHASELPGLGLGVEVDELPVAGADGEVIVGAEAAARARAFPAPPAARGVWLGDAAAQAVRRHFRIAARDGRAFIDPDHAAPTGAQAGALVGRAGELLLVVARAEAAAAGAGQIVGIAGPPGIGKSRLVAELSARLPRDRFSVVETSCAAHASGFAYHPIAALVRSLAGLAESDGEVRAREALFATVGDARGSVPDLLRVLGIDLPADGQAAVAPEATRARVFAAVRALLLHAAATRPLVILIEDVHWADRTSRELLDFLAEGMGRAPLLLLATYRPESEPSFMARPFATRIALAPLSRAESRGLIGAVLPPEKASLTDDIVERAEGNPLFLEELALAVRGGAALAGVPDSIHGILRLRMERLSPAERRLIQVASVLGRHCPRALLASVWDGPEPIEPLLEALDRADLLYAEDGGHRFKHALTRDAAHEALVESERTRLHERAARALEAAHRDRPADACELIAHHYCASDNQDKAIEYLLRAQAKAYRRFALDQSVAYFLEAQARLGRLPGTEANLRRRIDLLLNQCDAIGYLARLDEYRLHLETAWELGQRLGDPAVEIKLRARRGCLFWWIGRYHEAIEELEPCLRFGPDSPAEEYNLGVWLTHAYRVVGQFDRLFALAPRVLPNMIARGSVIHRGYVESAQILALHDCGRFEDGRRLGLASLATAEASGDPVARTIAAWSTGFLLASMGEIEHAVELVDSAVRSAPTPLDSIYAVLAQGRVYATAGRPEPVLEVVVAVEMKARRAGMLNALQFMAVPDLHLALGRWEDARRELDAHLEVATAARMHVIVGGLRRRRGWVALRTGDLATARAQLGQALGLTGSIGAAYEQALTLAALGELALAEGATEAGRAQLADAAAALAAIGAAPDAARARQLLGAD